MAQKEYTTHQEKKPLRIFTWHIHGSYLYYLTQTPFTFYLPVTKERNAGYAGKTKSFSWGPNVHEIPVEAVKDTAFDAILFQSNYGSQNHYHDDQYEIFSKEQQQLPKIYIEHDPPRQHPTDTNHIVDDPHMLLVHVTHFNELMWDNNQTPTTVIEHGVNIPRNVMYTGTIPKGVVMINNLASRGRRLGLDIFETVRKEVPLDLIGMGSEALGGLGEIPHRQLPQFLSQYRFFFNPIRYTSLGLSVCEAMMIGLPVVGLATTEMPTVITNEINGYVDTNVYNLIGYMKALLQNPQKAHQLSAGAQKTAQERFSIERFTSLWEKTIQTHIARSLQVRRSPSSMGKRGIQIPIVK